MSVDLPTLPTPRQLVREGCQRAIIRAELKTRHAFALRIWPQTQMYLACRKKQRWVAYYGYYRARRVPLLERWMVSYLGLAR